MTNSPAVVIIPGDEDRLIGPFASSDAASNWAFKHLPLGVQWHWLPVEKPENIDINDYREG